MRSVFGNHELIAAKKPKVVDSLSAVAMADMDKIETFLSEKMFGDPVETTSLQKPKKKKTASDIKRMLARSPALKTLYSLKESSLPSIEDLARKYGVDKSLLEEGGYSFGYLVPVSGLIYWKHEIKSNSISDSVSRDLKPFLMSIDPNKVSTVTVLKGKVVDLNVVNTITSDGYAYPYVYVAVKADPSRFKAALSSLKATGSGANLILSDIYHKVVTGRSVPPVYTKKIAFDHSIDPKAYIMPSGRVVYIPEVSSGAVQEQIDNIRSTLANKKTSADGSSPKLPKNCILFPDASTSTLVGTDPNGYLVSYSLSGLMEPDNKYKLHLLNKPLSFFTDRSQSGLSFFIPVEFEANLYRKITDVYTEYGRDTLLIEVIDKKEITSIIVECIKYGFSRYGGVDLVNWMSFMGILHVLKGLKKNAKSIASELKAKESKFKKCTPDEAPAIPNMKEGSVRFPHQAEALAKLDVAVDSAIIDVATGGGKANILIQDCINLLNKGLIRRPIIVMPNNLISQFLSEISFFTGNQVNGFALTSSVEARRGRDELAAMVKRMPLNTIFVTTFSWLSKGGSFDDYNMEGEIVNSFESTEWLKNEIGIDYVAVDESQNIKNMTSAAFKAVVALGRGIKYKRISTGTLISNKPTDLIGQLMFLDPLLIGTRKEFDAKYAIKGDGKNGYKHTMAEEIRARLRSGSSYIMYREKDWAPLLPKKEYSFSRVEQEEDQAKVYKALVSDIMDEIKSDPALAKAWRELVEEGDSLDSVPTALLGKLARLEMFLTAPDSSTLMQYANTASVSPKVAEIDRLISKSLKIPGPNNKVIVAVHYKSSARHLLKHSKHNAIGAYYDASQKDLITEFQNPKSDMKVLFAVVQSIKEGLNLQIANRIIVADVDWTPGNLKQLEARVFRPHVTIDNGNVINHNEGKTVYIDTVIADDSADCVKYAFQSYKKILNSIIMEECPVDTPRKVPFSDEALSAKFSDPIINGEALVDKIDQFNKWNQEEIDASLKKGDLKFREVKPTESTIGTDLVATPWVKGMVLPASSDEEPLLTYLEDLGLNTDSEDLEEDDDNEGAAGLDLTNFEGDLMGVRVRVEYGEGRIYSVRKASVLVRLNNGETVSVKPNVVLHKKGSVGRGLTKKDIREDREPKARKKPSTAPPAKTKKGGTGDDSHDPGVIKAYFKEKGIKYARQNNADGDKRCVLRFEGDELYVKTPFFKDLPLQGWNLFAEKLLNGETGTFSADGKKLAPAASKKSANVGVTPKKALERGKSPATPSKPRLAPPKKIKEPDRGKGNTLEDYLDDDFDFMEPTKPPKQTKVKVTVSKKGTSVKPSNVVKPKALNLDDDEDQQDSGFELYAASYNNIPSLLSFDENGEVLQDLDFTWSGSYWQYQVKSAPRAKAILEKLISNFDIPKVNLAEINKALSEYRTGIYKTAFPEDGVKAFLLKNRRKVSKGKLRMYPLVVGADLFFVVDVDTHPGSNLSGYMFKKKGGYYIYTAPNLAALKTKFKAVMKKFDITNLDEAKSLAFEHLKIRLS